MFPKNKVWILWSVFAWLLVYWTFRLWGHFPAFMDTMEYVFPEKWFNVESFQRGHIPLWNPWIACGTPHLAALQPAVFYPFFWIWNLTGLTDWFFILAILHEALAAVGFFLWLRSFRVSMTIASICALGFAGSALMTFYWGFPTHLASVAWVPWVLWASRRLAEKPGWRWGGLLSLFWGFQILAGYPFFTFYALVFSGVLILVGEKEKKNDLGWQAGAFLAALGLTAVQWLPFVDYLGYLHRSGWGDHLYELSWKNYLTLLQPHWLGVPGTAEYQGDYPDFIFNNLYLGIVPLGILLALPFSKKRQGNFWFWATLFLFLWPAGTHFFPLRVLPDALLDKLEPSKSLFLFVFCAFTAIGLGLDRHFRTVSKKNWVWKGSWVLGGLWLLDLILVPMRVIQTIPDPYRDPGVQAAAAQTRQLTGDGRLVSLKESGRTHGTGNREEPFLESGYALAPNTNVVFGLKSARGYLTIFTDGFQNMDRYLEKGEPYDGRYLDAAGVKTLLLPAPLPGFKYGIREKVGPFIANLNAGAMGTAWKVDQARELPGRPEVIEALLSPKAFLEKEVLTERSPQGGSVLLPPVRRSAEDLRPSFWDKARGFFNRWFSNPTTITETRPSACEAQFEVSCERAGFLVFDESFSPGWHAWVDGKPVPIFRADALFMAVPLAQGGLERVLFKYEPNSFRLGFFVSGMFIFAMSFGILILWNLKPNH